MRGPRANKYLSGGTEKNKPNPHKEGETRKKFPQIEFLFKPDQTEGKPIDVMEFAPN